MIHVDDYMEVTKISAFVYIRPTGFSQFAAVHNGVDIAYGGTRSEIMEEACQKLSEAGIRGYVEFIFEPTGEGTIWRI